MARDETFSPQVYARLAGLLYLIIIVGGAFAELGVRQRLFVSKDAAATAANILANEQLFRWGFVAQLVPLLCNMVLAVLLYELFKVVHRHVAMAVVLCSLVGSAVEAAGLLTHLAPLVFLQRGPSLGLSPAVVQAQASLSLSLQSVTYAVALTFFGLVCIFRGWLIVRSTFMPRFIGVLLAIQGVCYLINSFAKFLAPKIAPQVFAVLLVSAVGELLLCGWLLVRGVNAAAWRERAAA